MLESLAEAGFIKLSTCPVTVGLMTDPGIGLRCAKASLLDVRWMAPKPGGEQRC